MPRPQASESYTVQSKHPSNAENDKTAGALAPAVALVREATEL
jgi:hypothetical protein